MTRAGSGASGWNSPQIIVNVTIAFIGIAATTVGSYLALERNDSKEVRLELNDHARRLAISETRIDFLLREREEERRERRRDE